LGSLLINDDDDDPPNISEEQLQSQILQFL